MRNIYKLAFTGKMGAGKTSAVINTFDILSEQFGQENTFGSIISFAAPLHQTAEFFKRNEKPRIFLQKLDNGHPVN